MKDVVIPVPLHKLWNNNCDKTVRVLLFRLKDEVQDWKYHEPVGGVNDLQCGYRDTRLSDRIFDQFCPSEL